MLRDILTCTLLTGTALATTSLALGSPSNVVIFYVDDVGPDLIGLFDAINPYEGTSNPFTDGIYVQTPTMDSVASQGVTFLNAYTTPTCSSGRASLLTGMRASSHGVGTTVHLDRVGELAEFGDPGFQFQTLAQMAHSVNAQAAIFGKWHLSLFPAGGDPLQVSNWSGIYATGHWDEIHCTFSNLDIAPRPAGTPGYYSYYLYDEVNGFPGTVSIETTYVTSKQFDDALAYCNSAQEPFVAYVALNACHSPLGELPPANLVNTQSYLQGAPTLHKNHSAALEAVDTKLGHFLGGMSPARKANTVFILMGDNGPQTPLIKSVRDDGGMDLGPTYDALIDDAQPRFKHSVFEGGIRVPLIVWGAGVVLPGRTSDALVEVVDLFATTADLLGATTAGIDGVSFRPVLLNPAVGIWSHLRQTVQTDFFATNGDPDHADDQRQIGFSVLLPGRGRFKVVRRYGLPGPGSSHPWFPGSGMVADELYRLTDAAGAHVDPRELNPLAIDPLSSWRTIDFCVIPT